MGNQTKMTPDFSGYATRVGLKCTDGRTILSDAFQADHGKKVPLVYQHLSKDINNVLGHAILENRKDGVYANCYFNGTANGKAGKALVEHGDITALSIYANNLVEKGKNVAHGVINEVSLVIAGANPGAYIDNIAFEHGDGSVVTDESEAIISSGAFSHEGIVLPEPDAEPSQEPGTITHAEGTKTGEDDETLAEVFETLNAKQKTVVYAMVAHALEAAEGDDMTHSNSGGDTNMKNNIFDQGATGAQDGALAHATLTRDKLRTIFADARNSQSTLKNAFLAHGFESITEAYQAYEKPEGSLQHAATYGIDNIGLLFPDYKSTTNTPAFLKRDTDWVAKVFGASKHVPFSRIKTVVADITADEARARGYIKGNEKKEEVITLLKRTTDPQTIYKKQKLDRDDILDITDFDVVVWLRAEMRMMLEEEIARAELIGDGRSTASDDKIKEANIRPIATDDELYTIKIIMPESITVSQQIDQIILGRKQYKGSGTPSFFTTPDVSGDMLLLKDSTGRRLYNTENDLSAGIRAKEIVEVPVMENMVQVTKEPTSTEEGSQLRLIGVMVNMSDYSLGADKGGNITMFDDFDIDFNQYKYLIETRCSGALTIPKSAIAFWKTETLPVTTP